MKKLLLLLTGILLSCSGYAFQTHYAAHVDNNGLPLVIYEQLSSGTGILYPNLSCSFQTSGKNVPIFVIAHNFRFSVTNGPSGVQENIITLTEKDVKIHMKYITANRVSTVNDLTYWTIENHDSNFSGAYVICDLNR